VQNANQVRSEADYSRITVSADRTHHLRDGRPLYPQMHREVDSYHPPGLAPVTDPSGAYHIDLQGQPAYPRRFLRVFGFYEGLAAVKSRKGWYHIGPNGKPDYKSRWDWRGNFQEGFCPVRLNGRYQYIDRNGNVQKEGPYRYAGDFRKGIAVVRRSDGQCVHISVDGHEITVGLSWILTCSIRAMPEQETRSVGSTAIMRGSHSMESASRRSRISITARHLLNPRKGHVSSLTSLAEPRSECLFPKQRPG